MMFAVAMLSFMMFAVAIVDGGLAGFLLHPPFHFMLVVIHVVRRSIVDAGLAGFEDNPLLHPPL